MVQIKKKQERGFWLAVTINSIPDVLIAAAAAAYGAVAATKNRMPQATSDAHLRNALQSLSAIETQLANNGSTQHHARARVSIQRAIQELNTALTIR